MNYRHAFHAGNFADVMKHALLVRILLYLQRKETPIRVIDTHAGVGLYDLAGDPSGRTGEWTGGVGKLDAAFSPEVEELLAPYRTLIADVRERHGATFYPGSPAILREILRRHDRGVMVELHPADHKALSRAFNQVSNLKVLHLDGWTALHSLIPPKEKRGLVLIDPPYEEPDELERVADELLLAMAKWPTGFIGARLVEAGIGEFANLGLCTYTDEERFFSYRRATHRDEADYGRLISAVALVPQVL